MSAALEQDWGMAAVDALKPEHRALVHEYGLACVDALLQAGVTKPGQMRQIIGTIRAGGGTDRRPLYGFKPENKGRAVLAALDPFLVAQGAGFTGRQVVQVIRDKGYSVLPRTPTREMLEASLHALDNKGLVTRIDKHTLRLQAALHRGDLEMWGGGGAS